MLVFYSADAHTLGEHYYLFIFFSNCVKQGGILSPIIFNVYIDPLSVKLNASNIGRVIGGGGGGVGGVLVNHLCSADDI